MIKLFKKKQKSQDGENTQNKDHSPFILQKYLDDNGNFDYEKYRSIQIQGNKDKIANIWVKEENIQFIAEYIKSMELNPKFGLCHGTRRGNEQKWFKELLNCEMLGTDISDTANQFPDTIQWDFHKVKSEWLNNVDFIYSNSFDHSYDPEMCLNNWMSCIKPGGFCFLEHSSLHGPEGADELDPFGADITIMPYLITTWGKGRYYVRQILEAPKKNDDIRYLNIIVIQKAEN